LKTYIDKINVYGFKSYGDRRLTIPIGEGFIGIVGPNGAGKSNIGDSIVFALGIASAKAMRAIKLTDLIFSSKNKSAEYAEVEIIFKNLGAFPLNDEEVSIYRKIDHSGKSTYKINGRVAKQQEVEELLASAGIPIQGYNIVTQGDIFRFIKMTPAERRELLSEIAGITEYEEKKEKALKDLQETEEKINNVKIILKEIQTNLKRLEEEKENALLAISIENQINQLKQKILSAKLFNLLKEEEESYNQFTQIENMISKLYTEKENLIEKQKEIISIIKNLEDKFNEIQQSLLPIKEKEGGITAQIRLANEKKNELEKEIEALKQKESSLLLEKEEKIKEILSIEQQIKTLEKELPDLEKQLEIASKNLEEKNNQLKQVEIGGSKAKLDLGEVEKEEKRLKDEILSLQNQKLQLNNNLEKINDKINLYKEEIENLEKEIKNLEQSLENIKSYTQESQKRYNLLSNQINMLKVRKESLEKRLKENREKIEQNFKKLAQILANLVNMREDRAILAISNVKGVYGQVADLITIKDNQVVQAIESAAGNRLRNIVVENEDVAKECIEILKREKLGKATFIPLNKIKVQDLPRLPNIKGVKGFLIDFVNYDKSIEKAIKYVFADTILVENFDVAKAVGIGNYRMVTLDGALFEKSGVISGGTTNQSISIGRTALEQEREILEKEDDKLKQEEEKISKELNDIILQITEKEKELSKIQVEAVSFSQRKEDIQNQIIAKNNRLEAINKEIFTLKKQSLEIEAQIEKTNENLNILQKELSVVENRKKTILEKMETEGLHTLRKEWEEATNLVYALREKKKNIESQIERLKDRLENNLKGRIFQIETEKEEIANLIKNKLKEIENLHKQIEELSKDLSNLWKELKDTEQERENILNELSSQKEKLKILRYEEENINNQITKTLEDKGKLEQKLSDIEQRIVALKEEFQGEPEEGDIIALEKSLKTLEEKRKNLGAINEKAIEDYEETLKRFNEINEKLSVLIEEKNRVLELIEYIENKKVEAFMEVFNEVNKNLGKIFKRLSPGGKAYLELENTEEPLNGGVLLKSKPRGKEVKRIEIISGGEKTLTALSFLLAIQQYKPAPFYYFDEIDAHLDDANARKIAELFKEFSKEAQFIVVTLRDTMATYADRLIGVSAKDGISNVYTLDINQILGNNINTEELGS